MILMMLTPGMSLITEGCDVCRNGDGVFTIFHLF